MRRTIRLLVATLAVAAGVLVAAPAAYADDPVYRYQNQATGDCLLYNVSQGLMAQGCYADAYWAVHQWGDGTVRFQNVLTGMCMTDDFTAIGLFVGSCDASENQSWYVVYWGDGTRRFQNQRTMHCLDFSPAGLRTWECNSGENQSWWRLD